MYFPIIDALKENFIAKIPSIVTQWLTDNVVPVGSAVVVDESLSISGAAADAKKTGNELSDLKSDLHQKTVALGVCGETSFTVISGDTHSSAKDKLYCDISAGEIFYLTISKSGSASILCTLFGWKPDGTSVSIQDYDVTGTRTEITASADFVAIGVYMNPISATQTYTLTVEKQNSILQDIKDIEANIDDVEQSVSSITDVIGVYGKSAFTVPANTSHSSTFDNVAVKIKSGTTFYVTIEKSETPALNGSLFVHKSDGNVDMGVIAIDGNRHAFIAPEDITWVGLYLNPINYQQSYKMLVEMESSIYQDISTAGTELEDTTKRENVFKNSNVNFLFFTDVHGSSKNVEKIIDYANTYHSKLNFVVNGGDTVAQYLDDGISWYDSIVSDSDVDVLYCIGNHDCWGSSLYDKLPAITIYNSFIAPVISNVNNIVQPVDASTDGKCYYYKDYNNVRIIVLNAMSGIESVTYWDADAKSWLESVLADAKTNYKHVLCINHAPFVQTGRVLDNDSQWTSFKPYFDATTLEEEAVNAVEAFIADGGIFIAWLVGHTHNDAIMTNATNMLMIACATAHYADGYFHSDGWGSADDSNATYDCFNVCGIDTTNKILKIDRVGWCMDSAMKKRSGFSYDYQNRKILCDRG